MKIPARHSVERKLILFFLINISSLLLALFMFLLSIVLKCVVINIIPILIIVCYIPSVIFYSNEYFKKSYFKILLQYFKDDPIENVIPIARINNHNNIFGKTILEEIRIDEMNGVFIVDVKDVTYVIVPVGFYTNIIKNRNSYYIETCRTIIMLKDSDNINKSMSKTYRRISINITDSKLLNKIKLMNK